MKEHCWRMKFLACPVALKITMVLLWRRVYLQSFVPTRVQKYILTHTPDFTSFLPCSWKNSQKTGHAWLCPSKNNSITLPLTSFVILTERSDQKGREMNCAFCMVSWLFQAQNSGWGWFRVRGKGSRDLVQPLGKQSSCLSQHCPGFSSQSSLSQKIL